MPKLYSNTYLFNKYPEYQKQMFKFMMEAEQISKVGDAFADVRYEVKSRQVSNSLSRVLDSNNVILLRSEESMGKNFKVFTAKDIKGDHKVKAFIDCSGLISKNDKGNWACYNPDILVAHLTNAMTALIYQVSETKIINNTDVVQYGARCFSALFTHIIDYLGKISIMSSNKSKCQYLAAVYYQVNIMGKDLNDGTRAIARKISGISEREEDIIRIGIPTGVDPYNNIKFFVETVAHVLKLNSVTLDTVLEKWMYIYGIGTAFALEFFPAFSAMLTDAYVGCYLNNQKTIEKIVGRDMAEYTKTILRIGDGIA